MNSTFPDDEMHQQKAFWREIKVRLFYVYIGIAVFLVSYIISEFYEVFLDILLPVTQGSTGEARTITSVIFQSPFNAGWIGSMPWYGAFPLPSSLGTYHESWNWIFFTAAFTDNPYFLEQIVTTLLIFSFMAGLAFLSPLAIRTIRHSYLPSVFFFVTGMALFTKSVFGCLAQAFALSSGYTQIQYGIYIVTGEMIPNLIQAFAIGLPIILAIFAIFILLGRKLADVHFTDSRMKSWFTLYIAAVYWLGFAITIIVV